MKSKNDVSIDLQSLAMGLEVETTPTLEVKNYNMTHLDFAKPIKIQSKNFKP